MGRGFESLRWLHHLERKNKKFLVGFPSGQRDQTVNLTADAFGGSNPPPTTNLGVNPIVGGLEIKKPFWTTGIPALVAIRVNVCRPYDVIGGSVSAGVAQLVEL